MRVRSELRAHWRAWLALGLAFGLAGGAVSAAAAGARRTRTAYPRFVAAHDGFDVVTGGLSGEPAKVARAQRAIAALPMVEEFAGTQFISDRFLLPSGAQVSFPEIIVLGDAAGDELVSVNIAKVVSGRMFDANAPDEAVIDLLAAERIGLKVDDRVTVLLQDPETGEPVNRRVVSIVGLVLAPGRLPAVGQSNLTGLSVSPGFLAANAAFLPPNEDAPSVRLRRGAADIDAFVERARAIAPTLDFPVTLPRHVAGVQKVLRYDVSALWILAGLLALSSLLILGQAIKRQLWLEGDSTATLRALGMSRSQLVGADLLRAGISGAIGAVVSVGVAVAASPLAPRGLARLVEPDPGIDLDMPVLILGALATVLVAVLASVIPAIRVTGRVAAGTVPKTSHVATLLGGVGAPPSAVAGVRLALDAGRGVRAVPVRTAIGGVALALAALMAAATFNRSFQTLLDRPELYGFTWDVLAGGDDTERDARVLAADPDVLVAAPGGYTNVAIAGKEVIPLVYSPGTIEPTVLAGRAPRTPDEIALGRSLLRSLGLKIGDTVSVSRAEGEGPEAGEGPEENAGHLRYTIVGRVVVPPVFFQQVEPGESSAMTLAGSRRLYPEEHADDESIPHLIRYRPGIDLRAKVDELRTQIPNLFVAQVRQQGPDLSSIARSSELPILMANVLLLMAVGTLAHTLISSIRKRRGDLAILKVLGFVNRQVRATVAWQATTLVIIALIIGIPLGIATGRSGWVMFANSLGVVPTPDTPSFLVGMLPPAAIALTNIIALLPARAAASTKPAPVLHTL